jgi:hypothetical protein
MNITQKMFCNLANVQPMNVDVGLVMEEQFPRTLTDEIKRQRFIK